MCERVGEAYADIGLELRLTFVYWHGNCVDVGSRRGRMGSMYIVLRAVTCQI